MVRNYSPLICYYPHTCVLTALCGLEQEQVKSGIYSCLRMSVQIGVVSLYIGMKYNFQIIRSYVLKFEPCCDKRYLALFAACYRPLTPWADSVIQNSSGFNQASFTLLGKEKSSFKLTPLYLQIEALPHEVQGAFKSFTAHLFLTQISFAARPFLEKSSHFPRSSSGSCLVPALGVCTGLGARGWSGAQSISIQPQKEGQEKGRSMRWSK